MSSSKKSAMAELKLFGNGDNRTNVWATPQDFFNKINLVFNFTLDVCAIKENAKCKNFFSPEINGLTQDWNGVCWMNPPYSREISDWIKKASDSAKKGATVVALLPVRTDVAWWQEYCKDREIHYIKGRIKFGDSKSNAPFPCAIVIFRPSLNDVVW